MCWRCTTVCRDDMAAADGLRGVAAARQDGMLGRAARRHGMLGGECALVGAGDSADAHLRGAQSTEARQGML